MYSYYEWEFYDVETQKKENDEFIKVENFQNINEANLYIKRTLDYNCLDYDEKLVLYKRIYNIERDLIDEEIIKEVDYEN